MLCTRVRDWGRAAARCTCEQSRLNAVSWLSSPWECGCTEARYTRFLDSVGGAWSKCLGMWASESALCSVAITLVSIVGGHGGREQCGSPDQSISFLMPRTYAEMALWVALSILGRYLRGGNFPRIPAAVAPRCAGQDCTWSRQCHASLLVRRCILIALECALNAGFKAAIQSI